jgi:hypothetical protein
MSIHAKLCNLEGISADNKHSNPLKIPISTYIIIISIPLLLSNVHRVCSLNTQLLIKRPLLDGRQVVLRGDHLERDIVLTRVLGIPAPENAKRRAVVIQERQCKVSEEPHARRQVRVLQYPVSLEVHMKLLIVCVMRTVCTGTG